MPPKTENDLWIEMSIREVSAQAHFAQIAHSNIDPKAAGGNEAVFSSIHSFLSHCTMISKMLSAKYDCATTQTIGGVLDIDSTSATHSRTLRNHLEHYDERLKSWIRKYGPDVNIGDYNIGAKSAIQIPGIVFVRNYDPTTSMFTFVNEDFDLRALSAEVKKIQSIANDWIKRVESGMIIPPFL